MKKRFDGVEMLKRVYCGEVPQINGKEVCDCDPKIGTLRQSISAGFNFVFGVMTR